MKLVVLWGQGVTASHPGFVVDAQMIALLYEPDSSGPLRNILPTLCDRIPGIAYGGSPPALKRGGT